MKCIILIFLIFSWVVSASAQETHLWMLIIDPDPQGTNLRDSPGGKVKQIIMPGKTDAEKEMRHVLVTSQKNNWFSVELGDGTKGWLHQSVLGTCSGSTEEGLCSLSQKPDDSADQSDFLEIGIPLLLLEIHGAWAKVRTLTSPVREGWLPEQCLFSNPWNNCHNLD